MRTERKNIVENQLVSSYVFSSIQSASVIPFRDGSHDLFQRADFKQLRPLISFSNLAQVVDRRAFIGQNQHLAIDFRGLNTYVSSNWFSKD